MSIATDTTSTHRAAGNPRPVNEAAYRKELINRLCDRFTTNEQGYYVTNDLSTELIVFPSDLHPTHAKHLKRKVLSAKLYATHFADIDALNTLRFIPEVSASTETKDNRHLTLALYLYLADECSRLRAPMTFLTAMRKVIDEADAAFGPGYNWTAKDNYDATLKALDMLKLGPEHKEAVRQWRETGTFLAGGERQGIDGETKLKGAYAKLAERISGGAEDPSLNRYISYALGNRNAMLHASAKAAYARTGTMARESNAAALNQCIEAGGRERVQRIYHKIPELPKLRERPKRSAFAAKVFDKMPTPILELLDQSHYSFAYSTGEDISNIYPKDNLPGMTPDDNRWAREGKGLRQKRYGTIFVSNGIRKNKGDLDRDEELRVMVIAQSLLHEAMHIVQTNLPEEENKCLKQCVDDLRDEVMQRGGAIPELRNQLRTLNGKGDTLGEAFNRTSGLYTTYSVNDSYDEVQSNTLGFKYTELGRDQPLTMRDLHLPALDRFSDALDHAVSVALDRYRIQASELKGRLMEGDGAALF